MAWQVLNSSLVKMADYDPVAKTLRVRLPHGDYEYPTIPQRWFEDMLASQSIGRYFNENIKHLPHRKIS